MSTHADPHTDSHAPGAHHEEELLPDEPRTPLWLPLLGGALLLVGAGLALISQAGEPSEPTGAAEASAEAAPAPAPAQRRPVQPGHEGHNH